MPGLHFIKDDLALVDGEPYWLAEAWDWEERDRLLSIWS